MTRLVRFHGGPRDAVRARQRDPLPPVLVFQGHFSDGGPFEVHDYARVGDTTDYRWAGRVS